MTSMNSQYNNALAKINFAIQHRLQKLDLNGCSLRKLPPELWECGSLRVLDLGGNRLQTIPGQIIKLQGLQSLFLDSNHLFELPNEMAMLPNLICVDISGNIINDPEIMSVYMQSPSGPQRGKMSSNIQEVLWGRLQNQQKQNNEEQFQSAYLDPNDTGLLDPARVKEDPSYGRRAPINSGGYSPTSSDYSTSPNRRSQKIEGKKIFNPKNMMDDSIIFCNDEKQQQRHPPRRARAGHSYAPKQQLDVVGERGGAFKTQSWRGKKVYSEKFVQPNYVKNPDYMDWGGAGITSEREQPSNFGARRKTTVAPRSVLSELMQHGKTDSSEDWGRLDDAYGKMGPTRRRNPEMAGTMMGGLLKGYPPPVVEAQPTTDRAIHLRSTDFSNFY